MRRFLQTVGDDTWKILVKEAKTRDVSVQNLMKVEIIPMWLKARE